MSDVYEMVRQFRTTLGSAARHYIRLYELCEEVNEYDRAFGGDAYLMLDDRSGLLRDPLGIEQ